MGDDFEARELECMVDISVGKLKIGNLSLFSK